MTAAQIPAAEAICARAFDKLGPDEQQISKDVVNDRTGIPNVRFTATLDDRTVGLVCVFNFSNDESAYFNISTLAVDPDFQKRGIGHALMKHAEDFICSTWLKDREGEAYLVDATKRSNPSSRFYEEMGYVANHDDLDDAGIAVMYKTLRPAPPDVNPA